MIRSFLPLLLLLLSTTTAQRTCYGTAPGGARDRGCGRRRPICAYASEVAAPTGYPLPGSVCRRCIKDSWGGGIDSGCPSHRPVCTGRYGRELAFFMTGLRCQAREAPPTPAPPVCGSFETYNECGSSCPRTCDSIYPSPGQPIPPPCTAVCVPGCECDEGYVRDAYGRCLPPVECPVPTCSGAFEEYNVCGTVCPLTCDNFLFPPPCIPECQTGCFCVPGYVRDSNNRCVPKSDCPDPCPGLFESYTTCGSACPADCESILDESDPIQCPAVCVEGCQCDAGYVRGPNGDCVEPENCPAPCGPAEIYTDCASTCPKTCQSSLQDELCPGVCRPGCTCAPGYIRDQVTGDCVQPDQCPPKECGPLETYLGCGTACPTTCQNRDEGPMHCPAVCVADCFCKDGYIRDEETGNCVKPTDCPTTTECGEFETFNECGSACPTTCQNRDDGLIQCPAVCVAACFCNEGYIRDEVTRNCVKPLDCPTTECGRFETFYECGSACPVTCQNRDDGPIGCTKECVPDCFCNKGYIRDEVTGSCVKECPAEPPACPGENMEYTLCGSACPLACSNLSNPPSCIAVCREGCFCKQGYVFADEGGCVKPEDCPVISNPLSCPVDAPGTGDACSDDLVGETCSYGEESCCGKTYPSYGCHCSLDGTFGCFSTDACLQPRCECPTDPFASRTCSFEGTRCEYGQESCCGETHPSLVCTCVDGQTACYNTDACFRPPCDNP